jgi:hypothetical protein
VRTLVLGGASAWSPGFESGRLCPLAVSSQSAEEAIAMAKEAIEGYIETPMRPGSGSYAMDGKRDLSRLKLSFPGETLIDLRKKVPTDNDVLENAVSVEAHS